MNEIVRAVRRMILRMKLRSLEKQAETIMHARAFAYARLLEIERQCLRMEDELWRHDCQPLHSVR
ncbi:MAG TPA: hypothetical protein VIG66_00540 [Noviherbaspirillum sp.]